MTVKEKSIILNQIDSLLTQYLDLGENDVTNSVRITPAESKIEMLSIKEACSLIDVLSSFTLHQLIQQGKIPHVRAGMGKNGKILIEKSALLAFFRGE